MEEKKSEKTRGQSLIEMVFVISVVGMVISGIVFGMIYFSRVARFAKYRSLATSLAKGKIETLKAEKEDNPNAFWETAQNPAPIVETLTFPATFTRTITFSEYIGSNSTQKVKVVVELTWKDGSKEDSVSLASYFSE